MNIMCVIPQSHANVDGFDVRIQDEDENKIFEHQYVYGYDASHSREWAEKAHKDVENSIKYNWQNKYSEKPFVTDILVELVNKNNVEKIIVTAGKYVFSGKPMSDSDVETFIKDYITPNAQLSELYKEV